MLAQHGRALSPTCCAGHRVRSGFLRRHGVCGRLRVRHHHDGWSGRGAGCFGPFSTVPAVPGARRRVPPRIICHLSRSRRRRHCSRKREWGVIGQLLCGSSFGWPGWDSSYSVGIGWSVGRPQHLEAVGRAGRGAVQISRQLPRPAAVRPSDSSSDCGCQAAACPQQATAEPVPGVSAERLAPPTDGNLRWLYPSSTARSAATTDCPVPEEGTVLGAALSRCRGPNKLTRP